jgi:hypothetical protein
MERCAFVSAALLDRALGAGPASCGLFIGRREHPAESDRESGPKRR